MKNVFTRPEAKADEQDSTDPELISANYYCSALHPEREIMLRRGTPGSAFRKSVVRLEPSGNSEAYDPKVAVPLGEINRRGQR